MQLWTEYEGHTIDGAFLLDKLLLSEGRSAFFSIASSNGVSKLIRLIASHFDEEEILDRWRKVVALDHPNILKIERYGQVTLDDTIVVYAIFEPVDASLADVLVSQRLTVPEAKQLALSLASALNVLHKNGFVHEHVEPAKVFAVGEVVKLRGDCIRETPEGQLGLDAKKKDVQALATVALLAMAQTNSLEEATRISSLPAWLIELVRNARSGTWGLTEVLAALDVPKPVINKPAPNKPATPAAPAPRPSNPPEKPTEILSAPAEPAPKTAPAPKPPEPPAASAKFVPPDQRQPVAARQPLTTRQPMTTLDSDQPSGLSPKSIALIGLAAILVFWLIWHMAHRHSPAKATPQESSISTPSASTPSTTIPPATKPSLATKPSAAGRSTPATSTLPQQQNADSGSRDQWRVVAFTYNHQDQAQKKADTIAQSHSDLHPQVFSPTGHAPYLVTVGGVMNRDQAFAYVQKVRNLGLPRDSYAQNYSGKHP